jgi:hypothetical protein
MHGETPMSMLTAACCSLGVFAFIGSIVGWLAGQAVEDAVRGRLQRELAEENPPSPAKTAPAPTTP